VWRSRCPWPCGDGRYRTHRQRGSLFRGRRQCQRARQAGPRRASSTCRPAGRGVTSRLRRGLRPTPGGKHAHRLMRRGPPRRSREEGGGRPPCPAPAMVATFHRFRRADPGSGTGRLAGLAVEAAGHPRVAWRSPQTAGDGAEPVCSDPTRATPASPPRPAAISRGRTPLDPDRRRHRRAPRASGVWWGRSGEGGGTFGFPKPDGPRTCKGPLTATRPDPPSPRG
jgi:hypothetical protein